MKKNSYIAPAMEIVEIQTMGMLAASVLDPDSVTPEVTPPSDPSDIIGGEFGAPGLPNLSPFNMLFN